MIIFDTLLIVILISILTVFYTAIFKFIAQAKKEYKLDEFNKFKIRINMIRKNKK